MTLDKKISAGSVRWVRFALGALLMLSGRSLLAAETTPASNDAAHRDYLSANGLLNRGMYELAATEYRKFLSANAAHEKAPTACYGLAVALFRLNQFDEALKELKQVETATDFAFAADAGTMTAQCHLAQQRYGPAATAFQSILARFPDHALADDAAAGATEALYLAGDHDAASAQGKDFVKRFAESPLRERVLYFWGLAESQRGDASAAAERFDELLRSPRAGELAEPAALLLAQSRRQAGALDQALAGYRAIVQRGGKFLSDALAALASLLYERGDLDESARQLDRLLRDFPEYPQSAEARLQRARIRFDKADYKAALASFNELLAGSTGDQAAYWAAKCQLRLDDPAAAATMLASVADQSPDSPLLAEIRFDQAVALHRAGDLDAAATTLEQFRTRFPAHRLDAEALRLLAATEHQRKNYTASAALCAEFLSKHGDTPSAAEVRFLAAENTLLAGDSAGAVTAYRSFLTDFPSDAQANKAKFRLGLTLHALERDAEASPYLEALASLTGGETSFCPMHLALGDIAFAAEAWATAERHLTSYTACDHGQLLDDAWLKLGIARQRQERHDDALKAYDKALAAKGAADVGLRAQFERGQCLTALKRNDEAKRAFEAVVGAGEASPLAAHALEQLASLASGSGDAVAAAELFRRAASAAPNAALGADARFNQGISEMNAGRFAEAERTFAGFVERFPAQERAAEANARRGLAIARQERCEDAVTILDSAVAAAATLPGALRPAVAYERAWCLRRLNRLDDAAAAYTTLAETSAAGSYGLHALLELAELNMTADRFDEAAKSLTKLQGAVETDSSADVAELRAGCLYRLAVCEHHAERFAAAAELLETFLASYAEHPLAASARFYCGDSLGKLGRHEQAVRQFTDIVKNHKNDPVFAPTLLRLGDSLAALQRWALGEQTFTMFLDKFPDSEQAYQAHFGRAWAIENQGRFDDAAKGYERVLTGHQGPTAARAQFQIGQCSFAQNKYEDAARELLKVDILYAYPEWSAAALFEAGRCFEKLNQPAEARRQFETVRERHASTRWAKMADERLSELSSAAAVPGR